MTVSFQAFRDRYPAASITSEVLLVQSDRFVVKVTIKTDAAGCATGLAAHSAIEVAEDRARQRALVALGWLPEDQAAAPSPETNGVAAMPLTAAPTTPKPQKAAAPKSPTAPTPMADVPADVSSAADFPAVPQAPTPQPVNQATSVTQPSRQTAASPVKKEATAAAIATDQPSSTSAPQPSEPPAPAVPQPEPEPETAAAPPPEPIAPGTLPPPINLSDVIAQTDIELRRLGWSVETGRDYLEKTYQKRSRHELSEEELVEFLCHLESL